MDKKYGIYICEGCGIGDAVDIEKLGDVAKEEGLAVKTCPILCGQAGVELLKKDIADEGVNTLSLPPVPAGCFMMSSVSTAGLWIGSI